MARRGEELVYDKTVYSTEKALYHRDQMKSLLVGRQPYPVHVEIIISDLCNHDCFFCAYRLSGYTSNEMFQIEPGQTRVARNPNRKILTNKVFEIIDDCEKMGVKAIQFTGGGEPTVHPDFVRIVSYAQDAGFDTSLVTNGNTLHKPDHRSVALEMAWVRISIDAGTAQRYSEDRGISQSAFSRMCESVELLVQERNTLRERRENYSGPVIGVGFVVNPKSYTELYQAVELYASWGVDNVRLGLMFGPDDEKPYEGFRDEIKRQADAAVADFTCDDFAVINRTEEKLDDLERKNPEYDFCGFQNFVSYIGGDLNVYRCCVYAYHHHGVIGSLEDQGYKELWDSIAKRDDFEAFDARSCQRCQFNDINRSINAALSDPDLIPPEDVEVPLHVGFV